jgi:uncharacterized membrane protein YedE/YeeE
MLRTIVAVVVGYVVMFVLVFVTFTAAYLAMGADGAFRPGVYQVTGMWLVVSFVLGFVAALAGGYACAVVARSAKGPWVLAALVMVLGLAMAAMVVATPLEPASQVRTADVGNMEAMQRAQQPPWVAFVNPFLGAAGVLLGARLRRRPPGPAL